MPCLAEKVRESRANCSIRQGELAHRIGVLSSRRVRADKDVKGTHQPPELWTHEENWQMGDHPFHTLSLSGEHKSQPVKV